MSGSIKHNYHRKEELYMGRMIESIFESEEREGIFAEVDSAVEKECEIALIPFREKLTLTEYEQIRDMAFSVLYTAKKQSFSAGFRAAVKLALEGIKNTI